MPKIKIISKMYFMNDDLQKVCDLVIRSIPMKNTVLLSGLLVSDNPDFDKMIEVEFLDLTQNLIGNEN